MSGIKDNSTIVLVIDVLDECEGKSKISIVLKQLERAIEVKPVRLWIFLTSRPEIETSDMFGDNIKAKYRRVALDDTLNTKQDISAYFTNEFSKMERKPIEGSLNWPGTVVIEELTKMAEPLFIFAVTVCRFITSKDWFPEDQLKII